MRYYTKFYRIYQIHVSDIAIILTRIIVVILCRFFQFAKPIKSNTLPIQSIKMSEAILQDENIF